MRADGQPAVVSVSWRGQAVRSLRHLALVGRRLKASLERANRLTQTFTDSLLGVLPPMASGLGNALGIPPAQQQVFPAHFSPRTAVSGRVLTICCTGHMCGCTCKDLLAADTCE